MNNGSEGDPVRKAEADPVRKAEAILHWSDYIMVCCTLIGALILGVYFGIIRRRNTNSLESYFLGARNMGLVPVTVSLVASFYSAILILGAPGEVYSQSGVMIAYEAFGIGVGVFLAGMTFLPLMYKAKVATTFEVNFFIPN